MSYAAFVLNNLIMSIPGNEKETKLDDVQLEKDEGAYFISKEFFHFALEDERVSVCGDAILNSTQFGSTIGRYISMFNGPHYTKCPKCVDKLKFIDTHMRRRDGSIIKMF